MRAARGGVQLQPVEAPESPVDLLTSFSEFPLRVLLYMGTGWRFSASPSAPCSS